jgi:hypothetical protein
MKNGRTTLSRRAGPLKLDLRRERERERERERGEMMEFPFEETY